MTSTAISSQPIFRMATIAGILERITFQSDADGYTVGRLTPDGKRYQVTVVGNLPGVRPGETLELDGEWQEHREHGRQFAISRYRPMLPATIDGLRRYLGSGLIKGIGPGTAGKIVEHFGRFTLDILENAPERLAEVPGLGRKKAALIAAAWHEQRQIKTVMIFLQECGLPAGLAVKIYKAYGDEAIMIVRTNPYRLADEVYGIGFRTADAIAKTLGLAADDPARLIAGLRFALSEAANHGHCYLPQPELLSQAAELLEVPVAPLETALASPQASADLEIDQREPPRVALRPLAMAETGLAAALRRALSGPAPIAEFYRQADWPRVFAHLAEKRAYYLAPAQSAAVQSALCNRVTLLTGGPGTGKTTTLQTIVTLLRARGYRPLLAAPTGRAARRLAELSGGEASTIHRLLDYAPASHTFRRNHEQPLDCDMLIVDEVSMLDLLLANNLLKALPPHAHLLLVGDADQLPSVGPGRVLADCIAAGLLPHVHLEEVFRQAEGSGIAANARRINRGELPELRGLSDFYFFNAPDPTACSALVVDLVAERIPSRFGFDPQRDIQVLAPIHRGSAGVATLNQQLQAALNPPRPERAEKRFGEQIFRVGDRVIQQRNNYDLDVANGDVGVISAIDAGGEALFVQFDGDRDVAYDFSQLDELNLAYALSVHKSQGGEYPVVVLPLVMAHQALLQRNLLYTAITRARQLVVIVGDRRALGYAVANRREEARYSGLLDRLLGE